MTIQTKAITPLEFRQQKTHLKNNLKSKKQVFKTYKYLKKQPHNSYNTYHSSQSRLHNN